MDEATEEPQERLQLMQFRVVFETAFEKARADTIPANKWQGEKHYAPLILSGCANPTGNCKQHREQD